MKTRTIIAVTLIVLLTAVQAHAGPMTGALNYIQNNVVTDIETLAIIGLAFILFAAHVNWWLICGICAGIWIMANPSTITSAISGG